MIHLATGVVLREGLLLLVSSRYPNHPEPLWNLPGGRQLPGELLTETVVREVLEETGVAVEPREIAYVSESYDGNAHYLNVTFVLEVVGEPGQGVAAGNDHVAEVAWVPLDEIAHRMKIAVVREPLLAFLREELPQRYAGYHEAGVTIEWPADSR